MDQSPKICPKCQQANFPGAEFCRHCGEAIYDLGTMSRGYSVSRLSGYLIDGLFWFFEELGRWWELSRLNQTLKKLHRRRQQFMERMDAETGGELVDEEDRAQLMSLTEEISQVGVKQESLKRRSWAYTPEILFVLVCLVFLGGLLWINPRQDSSAFVGLSPLPLSGGLSVFRQVSVPGQAVVTSAAWHQRKLFVGGDQGLSVVDPATGLASTVPGLPPDFFVRHLLEIGNRLLIAGYGGVYAYEAGTITPEFDAANLPVSLINRLFPQSSGYLLGTIGYGLMQGRNRLATMILGTQGVTILRLDWFNGELWLLHEKGLMKGNGTRFSPVNIPVLNDKTFTAMAVVGDELYIAASDGILVTYKGQDGWVWSPMAGAPRGVTDVVAAGDKTLLLCAADGIFRLRNRAFETVVPASGQKVMALGREYFASAGPGQVVLYQPSGMMVPAIGRNGTPASAAVLAPIIPTVGTFPPPVESPAVPASLPVPLVAPPVTAPEVPPAAAAFPVPVAPIPAPPAGLSAGSNPSLAPVGQSAADPFFGGSPLPPGLLGPYVTSMAWDGRQFWAGTLRDGVWRFADGIWTHWNSAGGQLSDDQVVGLYAAHNQAYLYSWVLGLVALESGGPRPLFSPGAVQNLISIAAGDQSYVYLLFKDGFIRRFKSGGPLEEAGRVPEDFYLSVQSLQMLQGKPLVVVNDGVLSQDQTGRWMTTFFAEEVKGRKPLFSALAADGRLIIALDDGRVFAFSQRRLERIAALGTRPRALIAAGRDVWLVTANNVHRLEAGGFATVPLALTGPFQNLVVMPERQSVVILSESGLRGFRL